MTEGATRHTHTLSHTHNRLQLQATSVARARCGRKMKASERNAYFTQPRRRARLGSSAVPYAHSSTFSKIRNPHDNVWKVHLRPCGNAEMRTKRMKTLLLARKL